MHLIDLKDKSRQPNFHLAYIGPNKIIKKIRYFIQYHIQNNRIILEDTAYYGSLIDFIITPDLELILGQYHTYISGDLEQVFGAGRIMIDQHGSIVALDNHSGHYKPTPQDCEQMMQYFQSRFDVRTKTFRII